MVLILLNLIPEHEIYLEPFIGSGALALNHPRSPVEIVNDLDRDIANLYQVMSDREKGKELVDRLVQVPYDRRIFDSAREEQKSNFSGYNDIERAVLTYIVISQSFNAARKSFSNRGYAGTEKYREDLMLRLSEVYRRLEGVKVYNADAVDLLSCYADRKEVFAFLDPPYRHELRGKNAAKVYQCELSETQQINLLKTIRKSEAKILLCGYRESNGIDLYDSFLLPYGWKCYKLADVPKSAQTTAKREMAQEFIWCNYALPQWAGYYMSLKEYRSF